MIVSGMFSVFAKKIALVWFKDAWNLCSISAGK